MSVVATVAVIILSPKVTCRNGGVVSIQLIHTPTHRSRADKAGKVIRLICRARWKIYCIIKEKVTWHQL